MRLSQGSVSPPLMRCASGLAIPNGWLRSANKNDASPKKKRPATAAGRFFIRRVTPRFDQALDGSTADFDAFRRFCQKVAFLIPSASGSKTGSLPAFFCDS